MIFADQVQQAFEDVVGHSVNLGIPKHDSFGDYAVNVMQLDPRPTPADITRYVEELSAKPLFERVVLEGAFINVFISHAELQKELQISLNQGDLYGSSDWGSSKIWAIEHTSPNPNKAMHLGHLRNNITGMAIANLMNFVGVNVIRECVNNNRGIAIARLMWGYLVHAAKPEVPSENKTLAYWFEHQDLWETPETVQQDPGRFVDELYVKASADFKTDESIQKTVRQMVVDWEAEDERTWALWEHVLGYSYEGQDATLKRLGNHYDMVWHEHEHYQKGKDYVEQGLEKGIFVQTPEGTVITQLEKDYNLPDTVLRKSDGTSLYITQDLALTHLKMKKHSADHLFWVVGPEQSLALKQLFAVCEQLGIGKRDMFTHLTFGWMSIKGKGRMSSRSGNVVYIDDLLDEAVAHAKQAIREPEKLNEPLDSVAEKVGVGAVKYSLLKIGRNQDTAFDFDESLSFEGNSGPYIQYAYARMRSIARKAAGETETEPLPEAPRPRAKGSTRPAAPLAPIAIATHQLEPSEVILLRAIARFSEVVLDAAQSYAPHHVATYLFELTQKFNSFYETAPILEADPETRAFRLALTQATAQVVKNGLKLLGIEVLERM